MIQNQKKGEELKHRLSHEKITLHHFMVHAELNPISNQEPAYWPEIIQPTISGNIVQQPASYLLFTMVPGVKRILRYAERQTE